MGEIRRGNLSLSLPSLFTSPSQPTALPRPTTEDPLVRLSSSAGSGSNGRRKKKKPSRDGGEEKVLGAGDRGERGGGVCFGWEGEEGNLCRGGEEGWRR